MPYGTKEAHNKHCKEYYHTHNLKEKQTKRSRRNRWINKYLDLTGNIDNAKIIFEGITTDEIKALVIELRMSFNASYRLQNDNNDVSKEV